MRRGARSAAVERRRSWLIGALLLLATVSSLGFGLAMPAQLALLALLGLVAAGCAIIGLLRPQVAMLYLLTAMFLRLALPSVGADPFVLAFVGLLASCGLWLSVRPGMLPRLGWLEGFMVLYLLWNVASMLAPHRYSASYPITGDTLSVYRFILTGTIIPFALYLIGRMIYRTEASVRVVLWAVIAFAGYSALVSFLQFHAPSLVWPRYIVANPLWPGRAGGVFNQPVVNGMILIAGFVATFIIVGYSHRAPSWMKVALVGSGIAMAYGVYLTHTRAVWLCFLAVVLVGVLAGRGIRRFFSVTLFAIVITVVLNWSDVTSSDRAAGGVASVNEVNDRLNSIATSIWAAQHEPILGWGIGRFTAVNTFHHQQWSADVPWLRGLGISSHFNELGILVELGLIGLLLWLAVLVLLVVRLRRAMTILPVEGVCGRSLGLFAAMLLGILVVTGLTVDLRFFDFPNALTFLVVGIAAGFVDRMDNPDDRNSRRRVTAYA